jgi:hypothetical protein
MVFAHPRRESARRLRTAIAWSPAPAPPEARFKATVIDGPGRWDAVVEDHGDVLILRRSAVVDGLRMLPFGVAYATLHVRGSWGPASPIFEVVAIASMLAVAAGEVVALVFLRRLRADVDLAWVEEAPVAAIRRAETCGTEVRLFGEDDLEPAETLFMFAETRNRFVRRMSDRIPFTVAAAPQRGAPVLAAPSGPSPRRRSLRRPLRALTPGESVKALDAAKRKLDGLT